MNPHRSQAVPGTRALHALALAGTIALTLGATTAHAQTYRRPTATIVLGALEPTVASAVRSTCEANCAGTRWADRLFSEGTQAAGALAATGTKKDSALAASPELAAAARALISRQFLADDDFVWSNDTLNRRAEYSLSFTEAQREARAVTGPDPRTFGPLTANFVFVVSGTDAPKVSTKKKTTTVEATVKVAVFRIAYPTPDTVVAALGRFYCAADCADRPARKAAFDAYAPPLDFLAAYEVSASASSDSGQTAAIRALGESILDNLIDETAGEVPAFAINERLFAQKPPAARIGMKEGIRTGARFFVYRTEQAVPGGPTTERRGAMLLARHIGDNRVSTFTRTETTVQATRADSTTFKRVYPGAVQSGFTIREKPSAISIFAGAAFMGFVPGNPERGLAVEVRDEALTPGATGFVGLRSAIALKWVPGVITVPGQVPSTTYVGAGIGYEFFPLAGKFRVTPMLLGFLSWYSDGAPGPETAVEDGVNYSAELGVDVGFRLTPGVELALGFRQSGRAVVDEIDIEKSTVVTAPTLLMGLRFQRGRFGF